MWSTGKTEWIVNPTYKIANIKLRNQQNLALSMLKQGLEWYFPNFAGNYHEVTCAECVHSAH